VANTWLIETSSDKLDAKNFVNDCRDGKLGACFRELLDEDDVDFLQEFAGNKMVTETTVMKSLQIFGAVFYGIAKRNAVVD